MHIAICDDDKTALYELKNLIEEYREKNGVNITFKAFSNPLNLVNCMEKEQFDLFILDIVMPERTGLELASDIRKTSSSVAIIFLTTASEFAVASYRVKVQDYLLKPVVKKELYQALDLQMSILSQNEHRVTLHTSQGVLQLPISSIISMEYTARQLHVVQIDGTVIMARDSIQDVEKSLEKYTQFIRPHRSYIVNLRHVIALEKDDLRTINGGIIPVARKNISALKSQYMNNLLLNEMMEFGGDYE